MSFQSLADSQEVQRVFREMPEEQSGMASGEGESAELSRKNAEDREFALHLASGVHLWLEQIDMIIQKYSRHWRIDRIAKTELSILRLGVYEMLHEPDIPLKVSINEAVELSKEFGDEQSFPFINGILDAVARAVEHGEFGIHKEF